MFCCTVCNSLHVDSYTGLEHFVHLQSRACPCFDVQAESVVNACIHCVILVGMPYNVKFCIKEIVLVYKGRVLFFSENSTN